MIQIFTATTVTVSDPGEPLTVAFGEVKPDERLVHSLLFIKDDELRGAESISLEFNGQENACSGSSIDAVFLDERSLRVRLADGKWLRAGKVDDVTDRNVREIEARFEIPSSDFENVKRALQELLSEGCPLHLVPPVPRAYDALRQAVESAGFFADYQPPNDRMCVASEIFEHGLTGVSFWIARRKNLWFVATWGNHFYRLPETTPVDAVVIEDLRVHRGTPFDFTPEFKTKHGLVEITEEEFDRA